MQTPSGRSKPRNPPPGLLLGDRDGEAWLIDWDDAVLADPVTDDQQVSQRAGSPHQPGIIATATPQITNYGWSIRQTEL